MTYKINKTDGSLLAEIIDSSVDQTASDITLIGKNVSGYGEFINENFVKILENFANTSQPNNPVVGQIWFDTADNRLKVYDGNGFKNGSGPIVSGTQPTNLIQGDFWINSAENQLYFYDGTDLQLAGPLYKDSQGISGFEVETIYDVNSVPRVIVKLWVGQVLLGIFSKEVLPFTPVNEIPGFSGEIGPGFNQSTLSGLKFNVTSASSDALIDPLGEIRTTEDFMSTYKNTLTIGTVTINSSNSAQLILGQSSDYEIRVETALTSSKEMIFSSNISGRGYSFKVDTAAEALNISSTGKVTVNTKFKLPQYTTVDRDAMASPEVGELIYDTTANKVQVYTPSGWQDLN